MPRTFGDATVHQSHFDYAVKVDTPLPEHGGRPPTEIETKIGKQIAGNLVEDGATLQMGIDHHHHRFSGSIIAVSHLNEINSNVMSSVFWCVMPGSLVELVPAFQRSLLHLYQTTHCHVPEDSNVHGVLRTSDPMILTP